MRFFNTTGPVVATDHYCVPPLERLNLEELLTLIRDKRYFVLHAPRQTGKTSALLALQDLLNSGAAGAYRCAYTNVETAQAMREGTLGALRAILGQLGSRARRTLGETFLSEAWPGILETFGPAGALQEALAQWAEADRRPLVLLIDEIDSLVGDTLLAVLRQLRAGYDLRPPRRQMGRQGVSPHGVREGNSCVGDVKIRQATDAVRTTLTLPLKGGGNWGQIE